MTDDRILIIDDDAETASFLHAAFSQAGVSSETVNDGFAAMDKLREHAYCAVVLDPMIRHRLNGYAVLNFIELEKPEMLDRLFFLTGMSEQTIRRTAPAVLPRLFRKPAAATKVAAAVIAACGCYSDRPAVQVSVLLVEDDHVTAGLTVSLLEGLGFSVERVSDGREALRAAAEREFDVILLDLVMPDMDGFTVMEHFRDTRPGLLRRVIVTTGMPEQYAQALDEKAVGGVLRKPLDVQKLRELLRDCAANHLRPGSDRESA
jgi:CheY-like chemotaxis protein